MLLAGTSDAIAGANLQSALQLLAAEAGTSLDSVGMQPAKSVQALRLITAQVSLTAPWPVLVAFLRAVETAQPRMIVDSISLNTAQRPGQRSAAARCRRTSPSPGSAPRAGHEALGPFALPGLARPSALVLAGECLAGSGDGQAAAPWPPAAGPQRPGRP